VWPGAYEYLCKRLLPDVEKYDVSRLFIYWNARFKVATRSCQAGVDIDSR
jgi:hypothetical protein